MKKQPRPEDLLIQAVHQYDPQLAKIAKVIAIRRDEIKHAKMADKAAKQRYEDQIAFWKGLGVDTRIDDHGLWVPDWAETIFDGYDKQHTKHRDRGRIQPDIDTIKYLAKRCPDAATAVFAAGGLEALYKFATETMAADAYEVTEATEAKLTRRTRRWVTTAAHWLRSKIAWLRQKLARVHVYALPPAPNDDGIQAPAYTPGNGAVDPWIAPDVDTEPHEGAAS